MEPLWLLSIVENSTSKILLAQLMSSPTNQFWSPSMLIPKTTIARIPEVMPRSLGPLDDDRAPPNNFWLAITVATPVESAILGAQRFDRNFIIS